MRRVLTACLMRGHHERQYNEIVKMSKLEHSMSLHLVLASLCCTPPRSATSSADSSACLQLYVDKHRGCH